MDLSFDDHRTSLRIHALHPFPAKFPPQLARWAIERHTAPGDLILDPFSGSGTTLVEAHLLGRNALGVDIDPLACLIARVKATPVAPERVEVAMERLEEAWTGLTNTEQPAMIPEFPGRDRWFNSHVQRDLAILRDLISTMKDRQVRDFFLVVYSSIIIAKGPSTVANALDIAHSRAHYVERPTLPSVWLRFCDRYRRALRGLREIATLAQPAVAGAAVPGDARALPLAGRTVDAVISSPPYVTAIEYPRSHKFSVWWLGPMINVSHRVYESLRMDYIGTENVRLPERRSLNAAPFGVPSIDRVAAALEEVDGIRAGRVRRYFSDMRSTLTEVLRVLRPGGTAVLVVGDSVLRGVPIPTGACLSDLAESLNLDGARLVHRQTLLRTIRERSRQMPIKRGANSGGMRTEHVIVLQQRSEG